MATQSPQLLQINQLSPHTVKAPVKWSKQFLDRRMRQHKIWQKRETQRLVEQIIEDVLALPSPEPKPRELPLVEERQEVKRARVH
jgi:hypothetical protein